MLQIWKRIKIQLKENSIKSVRYCFKIVASVRGCKCFYIELGSRSCEVISLRLIHPILNSDDVLIVKIIAKHLLIAMNNFRLYPLLKTKNCLFACILFFNKEIRGALLTYNSGYAPK